MASKFDKAKSVQGVKEVAKESNEKANLITIKYFKNDLLLDYPDNNEDIDDTEDIEISIKEQGFTDPIEITDSFFECKVEKRIEVNEKTKEEYTVEVPVWVPVDNGGKYMIVSGHRRRNAGVKTGMKEFPCIVRHFESRNKLHNYVLHSNAHRDSAKDPLLLAKRYKMHEEYLRESGFKGAMADEVALRLGLKRAQADRYKNMNKVILPVWDMIRDGIVGMSSITDSGMHTHSPEEQEEILKIFHECIENTGELTRPVVAKIVKGYREGKKTWLEVIQVEMNEALSFMNAPQGVSVMNVNAEPAEQKDAQGSPLDRNNEVNYDYSHREGLESGVDPYEGERLNGEDMAAIEKAKQNGKGEKTPPLTEEEKRLKVGKDIVSYADKLSGLLGSFYDFESEETRLDAMECLRGLAKDILAELNSMADDTEKQQEAFTKALKELENDIKFYKKN